MIRYLFRIYLSVVVLVMYAAPVAAQQISSTDTTRVHAMRGTFYSDRFVGRKTSSGEVFVQDKYTAAHNSLKFGTLLLVTNPKNGKQVIVRVNDRCPKPGILDMTRKAANQIGVTSHSVQVQVLPPRYHFLWESQNDILDILLSGRFLEFAEKGSLSNIQGIFDLELFRCTSRDEAKRLVHQLPIYYQDKVVYRSSSDASEVIVRLELSVSRGKAEMVKKELGEMFRDIKIVSAQ
ncbi:MAG: hypothetical protein J6X58_00150 [Bacteroidales bacterium]|nr:hypothetical protein [Bacteroidales bacterium]